MILSTVIIDDEAPARLRLHNFLSDFKEIKITGEAENGGEAISLIDRKKPDLIFLDVQMPVANGFQVIEKIKHKPAVIFVTAYDCYAIKAFEFNAVDYLLKPYTKKRLKNSVDRIISSIQLNENREKKLVKLLEHLKTKESYTERISVKDRYVYKIFNVHIIDFFRIENGLVFLYCGEEKYMLDTPLSQLAEKLDPSVFFRAHRNTIVNISRIKNVIPWGRGRYMLEFCCDNHIEVSRNRIKDFKRIIGLII
jgi:two-component system, LytTR family, response regulator